MSLTFAFVMDPLERVNVHADTSFAFMLAAQARGHRVVHVPPAGVGLSGTTVVLHGSVVEVAQTPGAHIVSRAPIRLTHEDVRAIFIRTDPPFDTDYLTTTWLLSFAERAGVRCINSPAGLRAANEKLYALELAELCPRTIVSNNRGEIRDFVARLGRDAILKPIDGHGGFGVFKLAAGDSNFNALVDVLTGEGKRPVLAQELLEAGREGDRRLFMVNGALRAVLGRVPPAGDHRGNVHVGGTVKAEEITFEDEHIASLVGPRLKRDGLYFAGLDVIGGKLIEVNVTSPTLVQELKRLGGPDLAQEIVAAAEG